MGMQITLCTYHIKSVQNEQNVNWRKNLAMNWWPMTSWIFWCFIAPLLRVMPPASVTPILTGGGCSAIKNSTHDIKLSALLVIQLWCYPVFKISQHDSLKLMGGEFFAFLLLVGLSIPVLKSGCTWKHDWVSILVQTWSYGFPFWKG